MVSKVIDGILYDTNPLRAERLSTRAPVQPLTAPGAFVEHLFRTRSSGALFLAGSGGSSSPYQVQVNGVFDRSWTANPAAFDLPEDVEPTVIGSVFSVEQALQYARVHGLSDAVAALDAEAAPDPSPDDRPISILARAELARRLDDLATERGLPVAVAAERLLFDAVRGRQERTGTIRGEYEQRVLRFLESVEAHLDEIGRAQGLIGRARAAINFLRNQGHAAQADVLDAAENAATESAQDLERDVRRARRLIART